MEKDNGKNKPKAQEMIEQDSWGDISKIPPLHSVRESRFPRPRNTPVARSLEYATHIKEMRILIVDDDPNQRDALADALRNCGAEVYVGDQTLGGYEQAIRTKPDVVISDLTSPGERGWWLVERLRRHPLLRWTPILLLRWWDTQAGIRLDRVLERLEELFAPFLVIEERVAAGKSLSDRVEMNGVPMLLRFFTRRKLTGLFTVNDTWSVFEVHIRQGLQQGQIVSVVRRGVEGGMDQGPEAFMQLVLCDVGRWSFRALEAAAVRKNIDGDLDQNLDQVNDHLSALIGPEPVTEARAVNRLSLRLDVLADVASTLTLDAKPIADLIFAGAKAEQIPAQFDRKNGLLNVERTILSLIRCGAIRPLTKAQTGNRDPSEIDATNTVALLLEETARRTIEQFNPKAVTIPPAPRTAQPPPQQRTYPRNGTAKGAYLVSEVKPEKVAARRRENFHVPGTGKDENLEELIRETEPATGSLSMEDTADPPVQHPGFEVPDEQRLSPAPAHEAAFRLGATERPKEREKFQMWIAIALAVLLGAVIVAGLVFLGADDRELSDNISNP